MLTEKNVQLAATVRWNELLLWRTNEFKLISYLLIILMKNSVKFKITDQ